MPIYAYKCESCGHRQDVLQKVSDPLLAECPACGAARFVKQLTAAGFQLKGSGWYATDFRGGAKPGDGESGKPEKPEAAKPESADKPAPAGAAIEGAAPAAAAAKPAAQAAPAAKSP